MSQFQSKRRLIEAHQWFPPGPKFNPWFIVHPHEPNTLMLEGHVYRLGGEFHFRFPGERKSPDSSVCKLYPGDWVYRENGSSDVGVMRDKYFREQFEEVPEQKEGQVAVSLNAVKNDKWGAFGDGRAKKFEESRFAIGTSNVGGPHFYVVARNALTEPFLDGYLGKDGYLYGGNPGDDMCRFDSREACEKAIEEAERPKRKPDFGNNLRNWEEAMFGKGPQYDRDYAAVFTRPGDRIELVVARIASGEFGPVLKNSRTGAMFFAGNDVVEKTVVLRTGDVLRIFVSKNTGEIVTHTEQNPREPK